MICFASLTSCVFEFGCVVRPKPSPVFLKEASMTREVQVMIIMLGLGQRLSEKAIGNFCRDTQSP